MNKKSYQQPQTTTVKIGLSDNIMEGLDIGSETTDTQFTRLRNVHIFDDDEEDEEDIW